MPKIMAALGHFANDGEIKVLMMKTKRKNELSFSSILLWLQVTIYLNESVKPACLISLRSVYSPRYCWNHLWPISSPAPPPSDGQQRAQQSTCASTRDEPATFTPGSLTCCSVGRTKTPSHRLPCRNYFRHAQPFCWIVGLLVPVDDEHHSHLILGVLLTLRYLMPLLQQQVNTISLKGSFGVMQKEADVQPAPEQLLQVLFTLLRASGPLLFFLWRCPSSLGFKFLVC